MNRSRRDCRNLGWISQGTVNQYISTHGQHHVRITLDQAARGDRNIAGRVADKISARRVKTRPRSADVDRPADNTDAACRHGRIDIDRAAGYDAECAGDGGWRTIESDAVGDQLHARTAGVAVAAGSQRTACGKARVSVIRRTGIQLHVIDRADVVATTGGGVRKRSAAAANRECRIYSGQHKVAGSSVRRTQAGASAADIDRHAVCRGQVDRGRGNRA